VSPVNVTLERQPTASMTARIQLNTTVVEKTPVRLKVFESVVEADGVTVVLSFHIRSQEEFGEYQLVVSNNVMPAARSAVKIVPEGTGAYIFTFSTLTKKSFSRLVNRKTSIQVIKHVLAFQMYPAHLFLLKSKTSAHIQRRYHGQKDSMAALSKLFTLKSALTTTPGRRILWTR